MKRSLKDAAKKGHMDVCKVLAREIVTSRKAQNKLHAAKAHMNSVQMQMKNQLCKFAFTSAVVDLYGVRMNLFGLGMEAISTSVPLPFHRILYINTPQTSW